MQHRLDSTEANCIAPKDIGLLRLQEVSRTSRCAPCPNNDLVDTSSGSFNSSPGLLNTSGKILFSFLFLFIPGKIFLSNLLFPFQIDSIVAKEQELKKICQTHPSVE